MGSNERRERERAETRKRILDAAREVFATEGVQAVTMRHIAERIEYSPTAIYFHFKDKAELLRAMLEADLEFLAETFVGAASASDPVERLRETGLAYIRFGMTNPKHYRMLFMEPLAVEQAKAPLPGEAACAGQKEGGAYVFLQGVVQAVAAAGRFRPGLEDTELVAQSVWSAVHGVVSLRLAMAENPDFDWREVGAIADVVVDSCVRGMTLPAAEETTRKAARAAAKRPPRARKETSK